MSNVQILQKGESVKLRGDNRLSQIFVGLGWDPARNQTVDVDSTIVARNGSETVFACYYGSSDPRPWIHHYGDNLTGDGEGDDEIIRVDLDRVDDDVLVLDVFVNIYEGRSRNQTFGSLSSAYVRLVDISDVDPQVINTGKTNDVGVEKKRYDLASDDLFTDLGLHVARLRRSAPKMPWEFVAVGISSPDYETIQMFVNSNPQVA